MAFKKVKVRKGLAGLMWMQMEALNYLDGFKNEFKDTSLKVLMNPKDQRYAALLKINNGTIDVDAVRNDPENLKKVERDALFEGRMEIFLGVFMGGLSAGALLKNWITRKVKLRGLRKMMALAKIMEFMG